MPDCQDKRPSNNILLLDSTEPYPKHYIYSITLFRFKFKFKLSYYRWTVGQSVVVSGHHPGPSTIFPSPRKLSSDICALFSMGRPLWREDGSVTFWYKNYEPFPVLSLSGPSPAPLETISCYWKWVLVLSPLTTRRAAVEIFEPASI
jgi:hypothetical protein